MEQAEQERRRDSQIVTFKPGRQNGTGRTRQTGQDRQNIKAEWGRQTTTVGQDYQQAC
jgi:hypothetical protein